MPLRCSLLACVMFPKCSVQSSGRYSHKFPTRLSPAGSSLSVFPMLLFPICAFLYHISASIQIQILFVKEFNIDSAVFYQLKALMYRSVHSYSFYPTIQSTKNTCPLYCSYSSLLKLRFCALNAAGVIKNL